MTEKVVLQTKPSILPAIIIWMVPGIVTAYPLMIFTLVFAQTLGGFAAVFFLLGMLLIILSFIRMLVDVIQLEFTSYILTETQIIKEYGVVNQQRITMPRDRSTTSMLKPLFGRIFNFGNLRIYTEGLGTRTLRYIPDPEKWQEEVTSQTGLSVRIVKSS